MANAPSGHGIEQLARDTDVTHRLADPGDFFPFTVDRCIALCGQQTAVVTFLWNMGVRAPRLMRSLSLILPIPSVSAIIGQGGSTIKHMQQVSGSKMKVEDRMDGVKERILRITGYSGETVFKALRLVLDKLSAEESMRANMHVSYVGQYRIDPAVYQQYLDQYLTAAVKASMEANMPEPKRRRL